MIPANNPKIVIGANVIWLPALFSKLDCSRSRRSVITKGMTYNQVASFPSNSTWKGTTAPWHNTSDYWYTIGGAGAAGLFIDHWRSFWDASLSIGTQFTFYRTASFAAAADGIHRFDYCCWANNDDGIKHLTGYDNYQLEIEFITEGAAR